MAGTERCWWCGDDPLYVRYHDTEWGMPVDDDVRLFEKVCLEGFQSGLSWLTILRKRENFRAAFDGFDFEKVARFGDRHVEALMQDAGIVRNRAKILATINNAGRACEMAAEFGSLAAFVWRYEPDASARPPIRTKEDLYRISTCPEAKTFSRDLKKRGWSFVGPTTAYAFMQSMGMVNDHLTACPAHERVEKARRRFKRPA